MVGPTQRQVHELFIQTSAEKLSKWLTNGALTPACFFGTVAESSFEPGAPTRFDLPNGTPTVKGIALEREPRQRLAHPLKIRSHAAIEDETSTAERRLEPRGKACRVVALHDLTHAPKRRPTSAQVKTAGASCSPG